MLLEARERGKEGAKEGREPSLSKMSAEVVVEGEAWRGRRGERREGKKEEEKGCGCLGGCVVGWEEVEREGE